MTAVTPTFGEARLGVPDRDHVTAHREWSAASLVTRRHAFCTHSSMSSTILRQVASAVRAVLAASYLNGSSILTEI